MSDKPKVAVYCRVASANDFAIKAQEKMLLNYAAGHGLSVGMVYSDNGASGLSFERPAFQQMMLAVERGAVDCIIVKNICKISRNYVQFGKWHDEMCGKNIRLVAVDGSFDSKTYYAKTMSFAEALEKYYRESHSKKIKADIAHSRRKKLEQAAKNSE